MMNEDKEYEYELQEHPFITLYSKGKMNLINKKFMLK